MVDNLSNARYPKSYGAWAGSPDGVAPDYTRCCEAVSNRERFTRFYQCKKARGFGPDGAFCKQHDPSVVARKQEERKAAYHIKNRRLWVQFSGQRFLDVLTQIADGHNDPRTIAKDVIADFERNAR